MSGPTSAMILAAGFGMRMGDLVANRPKPMIEVSGRPLIDHALAQIQQVPISQTVVNGHHFADQLGQHLAGWPKTTFLKEMPDILDSGGAVKNALGILGAGPIFTLNSDAVWTGAAALQELQQAWRPDDMDALLLLVPRVDAVGRLGPGDFEMAQDGRITLRKRPESLVYTGAQILNGDLLLPYPEGAFSMHRVWDEIAMAGRLFGVMHHGKWADVGHPEGIALAEEMLRQDGSV
jgi:MurNAc alpha-1-phosphate uridylyltransferase